MRKRQPSRNEGMAQSSKRKNFDRHTGSGWPPRGPPSGGAAHRVPGLHSKAVGGGGQVHQLSRAATTEHHRWECLLLLLEARGPWSAGNTVAPEKPERRPVPASLPAGALPASRAAPGLCGPPLVCLHLMLSPPCASVSASTFASVKTPATGLAPRQVQGDLKLTIFKGPVSR